MQWQAYCKTCNELLVECPNSEWPEATGRAHMRGTSVVPDYNKYRTVAGGTVNCDVIIGHKVELNNATE